jgi:hypothetical protein
MYSTLYIKEMQDLLNDSTFFLSITTVILASFAVIVKACYKSKCSDFQCCYGLIKIERDNTVSEEHIDMERNDSNRDFIPRSEN